MGGIEKQVGQGVLHEGNVEPDQRRSRGQFRFERVRCQFALQVAHRRLNQITRVVPIKLLKLETEGSKEVVQQNVPAALFTEKGGSNSAYAGAIGILVLQRYRVTFNYRQRLMILETTPTG